MYDKKRAEDSRRSRINMKTTHQQQRGHRPNAEETFSQA
jgi:hypothetical protein